MITGNSSTRVSFLDKFWPPHFSTGGRSELLVGELWLLTEFTAKVGIINCRWTDPNALSISKALAVAALALGTVRD